METQYFRAYSPALGREMECKVYGHAGRPVLFIPCQDGQFIDFEAFHMTDTWRPWIESGQVMVFSIDTIDKETWSAQGSNEYWRARRHEQWIRYIVDEMVPFIHSMAKMRNGWHTNPGIMLFGCSMGASHSVNLFLRFPDIFDRMLALSGLYTVSAVTWTKSYIIIRLYTIWQICRRIIRMLKNTTATKVSSALVRVHGKIRRRRSSSNISSKKKESIFG